MSDPAPAREMTDDGTAKAAPTGYTAVVFFHGMGSQRRYGEMSNFLQELEEYDRKIAETEPGGWLKNIEGSPEESRTDKIEYFITYGSPIDKIYYFFQNNTLDMHRYQRVLEGIRGDINQVPLSSNDKPHIHWINFWDVADIISGALQTPLPLTLDRKTMQYLRVDNYQVANGSHLPASSHVDYMRNAEVRAVLYDCIFKRKYAFFPLADPATSAAAPQERPDYTLIGSSRRDDATRRFHILALTICWAAPLLVGLIGAALSWWFPLWIWRVLALAPIVPVVAGLTLLVARVSAWLAVRRVTRDVRSLMVEQQDANKDAAAPAG